MHASEQGDRRTIESIFPSRKSFTRIEDDIDTSILEAGSNEYTDAAALKQKYHPSTVF
jgi:hypothetical protein